MIEGEKAAIGALITLREPTAPMLTEAASAGFYESENFPEQYPRLQILTIADLSVRARFLPFASLRVGMTANGLGMTAPRSVFHQPARGRGKMIPRA